MYIYAYIYINYMYIYILPIYLISIIPSSHPTTHPPTYKRPSSSPGHDAMLRAREIHQGDAALHLAALHEDATETRRGGWGDFPSGMDFPGEIV